MDSNLQKLQSLGVFGIIKETIKLIYQWRKIFTQITLLFILPSYLITFTNFALILFASQNIYFLVFNLVSIIITAVLTIIATATVVYTVACVYAKRDISFKHVIGVVPNVWKPVLGTSLCYYTTLFALNFVGSLVVFLIVVSNKNLVVILFIFLIMFFIGTFYLISIWKLSDVVAVLEGLCGFKAMAKSKGLVKGKVRMVKKLVMALSLPVGVVQYVFFCLVVQPTCIGMVGKGVLVIIWILSFSVFFLVTQVAKTVLYFVCKLDHDEIVDKLALSDHLRVHLLENYNDPLKVDDHVRIEKLQVV
ncbi:uncharacterized protein LOC111797427 [Cucurbita pepo subsp. pepo]|uniref:uncharacterized protein LOC111797427 n=1 Tax=Cucurbita pepo subsp. pepo TaxID=3664 RepID=UPI000C9D3F53|nr:uncharacterized protein LOC111797427 [Cucurbita pepo subsp. pepo]